MSPHTGTPLSGDEWKRISASRSPLLSVVAPSPIASGRDATGRDLPTPKFFKEDGGAMRPMTEGETTW